MPKTLLEVFTETKEPKRPTRKKANRFARGKGAQAEIMLARLLTDQGYEVRRTHLSAFPDIVAWNEDQFLLIEVKARTSVRGVSNAVYMFKTSAKLLKVVNKRALLLCYVRFNDEWQVYQWTGSGVKII
jgi:Holliday junction resolvase